MLGPCLILLFLNKLRGNHDNFATKICNSLSYIFKHFLCYQHNQWNNDIHVLISVQNLKLKLERMLDTRNVSGQLLYRQAIALYHTHLTFSYVYWFIELIAFLNKSMMHLNILSECLLIWHLEEIIWLIKFFIFFQHVETNKNFMK